MENPFNYLQFATGDQFYDRKEIRKDLLSRFLSGQSNVTLSVSQKKLLIALARERTDEFGDAYRRRYALGGTLRRTVCGRRSLFRAISPYGVKRRIMKAIGCLGGNRVV